MKEIKYIHNYHYFFWGGGWILDVVSTWANKTNTMIMIHFRAFSYTNVWLLFHGIGVFFILVLSLCTFPCLQVLVYLIDPKIYTRPVSFHFPVQTKKKCTSILIFMLNRRKTPKKSKKSMSIFPSRDQCLSLENICHSFLMLPCRRMPWECKYYFLKIILSCPGIIFITLLVI